MPNPSLSGSFKEGGLTIPGSGGEASPYPPPRTLSGKGFITLGTAGSSADFGPDTPGTSTNGAFEAFFFQGQLQLPVLVVAGTFTGPANAPAAVIGVSLPAGSLILPTGAVLYPSSGGGLSPATTVTGPDAYSAPAIVGTSLLYARQDHDHGLRRRPQESRRRPLPARIRSVHRQL